MRNQAPSCQARDITRQGFKLQARQDCLASFQRRLDARRFQRKRVYSGSSSSSTHPSASRARSTLTSCSVLLCRKCTSTVCAEVLLCIDLGRGSWSLSCFWSRLKEVKDKGLAIGIKPVFFHAIGCRILPQRCSLWCCGCTASCTR